MVLGEMCSECWFTIFLAESDPPTQYLLEQIDKGVGVFGCDTQISTAPSPTTKNRIISSALPVNSWFSMAFS